jgi:UDP-N-acetylmuramoyl-L-alanyl-D-glutamate--2,6-diaminopimelate ligase
MDITGSQFKLTYKDDEIMIRTPLVGAYNIYNILCASSAALAEGMSMDKIKKGVELLHDVPGRLEKVDCGQEFSVFIDYAHTHDALENVLRALRKTCDSKIIVVFGCGGDRDNSKRPKMGKVVCELADHSIVTNDNPRTEDPDGIIRQITDGFEKDNYEVIQDRKLAIQKALSMAQKGDIVLIAGKGHETYQIFKDKKVNFDERKIVREFILC